MSEREYDVVLFGATGFTGGLTADYLAAHAPEGVRWAMAGRNLSKLEAVRERLGGEVALLVADVDDPASITKIAESAKVVATTVGPYVRHGEPLVAACAKAGTHYVDLTGEPEFVDTMYLRHHETALASGARLVHACGFDSIPHDLGAQFCVEQLPEGVPLHVRGFVRAGGLFSGGTFDSATTAFSRARQTFAAARDRRRREGPPAGGRRVHVESKPVLDRERRIIGVPMPTIDPQVIVRSAAALERYGPDFTYGHYAGVRNPLMAIGGVAGVAAIAVASQIGPVRRKLVSLRPPGTGPSEAQRAKAWFEVRFTGEGGGQKAETRVTGGDPGYTETAKMLAESALCLAFDDLPDTAGQVTTAVAMGPALRERLVRAGIGFEVVRG